MPLVRGLLRQALEYLGVVETGIDEIVLALTEACANVVQHAGEHEEYQVDVAIDDDVCRISVLDDGDGFDPCRDADAAAGSPLDGGRGLLLMRALVDRLAFVQDARRPAPASPSRSGWSPTPRLRLAADLTFTGSCRR